MNDTTTSILVAILIITSMAYILKLDLKDITGYHRKRVKKKLPELAQKHGLKHVPGRTEHRIGTLEDHTSKFTISIEPDSGRIWIEFRKQPGIYLDSIKEEIKLDFPPTCKDLQFESGILNTYFKERKTLFPKGEKRANEKLELLLLQLLKAFGFRRVKNISMNEDYLRFNFQYPNYLPIKLMEKSLPLIRKTCQHLSSLPEE